MKGNFVKARKYIVLALFLLITVLSLICVRNVAINYNISDYLNENTETKISLDIIADEFGAASDVQVMVEDVTVEQALSIRDTIKGIKNVANVNFDEKSENYYKDGDALFVVLVNGDEYSSAANEVAAEIKAALDSEYNTVYGGAVMEKSALRRAIQSEIVLILIISVCLAIVIMLLTSKSWLEPLILLAASGIAILINMGTNIIFGEISYITNAVAAILQLALSIDYSIVLLHQYRAVKAEGLDSEAAMMRSIKEVIKPVSTSALTTVAGLLALLFMSFRIGFDIGIVLMKGIVISAITSLTLLPAFLILFERLMEKTAKRDIKLKGKFLCDISFKFGKFIVPVALALVIVCGALQSSNVFTFTDNKSIDSTISDRFGKNSTVLVIYPQSNSGFDKETLLHEKLNEFKTKAGENVIKSCTAYSTTVREYYDVKKTSEKLGIPEEDVELLLTMYHLDKDPALLELRMLEFVEYANALLATDEDAAGVIDESTVKTMAMLVAINTIMEGEHTAEEFFDLATTGALEGTPLDLFSIKQMYGLYFYGQIAQKSVNLESMIDFMAELASKEENRDMFDADMAAQLAELRSGIDELRSQEKMLRDMRTEMSQNTFKNYLRENYGTALSSTEIAFIYASYCNENGLPAQKSIRLDYLLNYLVANGYVTDAEAIEKIDRYNKHGDGYVAALEQIKKSFEYGQFVGEMTSLVKNLTGEELEIKISELAIQQVYIMYFYEQGTVPTTPVSGREFVDFINATYPENPVIAEKLSDDGKAKLSDICVVDEFLLSTEKCNYEKMTGKLTELQNSVTSISSTVTIGSDKIMGVYLKYAVENDLDLTDAVMGFELLDFVADNMETNEFLKARMTDSHREKIKEAQKAMASAESMLIGEKHNRMLIAVDLPAESDESSRFVEYLTRSVKEIFGNDAHVAGEMVSTHDLKVTFDGDNTLISIFTIVSIFVIIMVVFRSISLPVVLVAVIQGAIWITMSSSIVTGPMFFMSYIMATCILMGATIDYGILMSTNYVDFRASLDKKEALIRSVDAALPTVFTSGITLIICGAVVGVIASQNSISTVGVLLGLGTFVSVLMITLVLPSLLYLLDGFVMKLSMKKKSKSEKSTGEK